MNLSFFSGNQNFKRFCSDVCKFPLLTPEAEIEAVKSQNIELLVISNLRLVIKIAHTRVQPNIELEDLIQAGCVGLIQAANKYSLNYEGVRFANYAPFWIKNAINEYIRTLLNRTRTDNSMLKSVKTYIRDFESKNGFEPPIEYIAEELDLTEEKVMEILGKSIVSFDSPLSDEVGSLTLADTFGCEAEVEKEEEASYRTARVESFLSCTLNHTENEFVHYKYGYMSGGNTMNLTNVANSMGITRQWADKLNKRVKEKLTGAELRRIA